MAEGCRRVLASTRWRDRYLVRFVGADEIVLRRIDPLTRVFGAAAYAAMLNGMLAGAATSGGTRELV